jgi:hypothetical protein
VPGSLSANKELLVIEAAIWVITANTSRVIERRISPIVACGHAQIDKVRGQDLHSARNRGVLVPVLLKVTISAVS